LDGSWLMLTRSYASSRCFSLLKTSPVNIQYSSFPSE
jgi:hypothetical protein